VRPRRSAVKPYAQALWELARERGQVEQVDAELERVVALLDAEPTLRAVLTRPWVPVAVRRAVAQEVAARLGCASLVRDFVALAAAQGRGGELAAILDTYRALVDEGRGRVRARVRTAVPLTPEERAAVARALGQALGGKQVVVEDVVDPRLLAGFIAEVNSYMVDASLDGQLARLRERLARG
jgi:F-type H+-transporting ATPase subunit delta